MNRESSGVMLFFFSWGVGLNDVKVSFIFGEQS